MWQDYAIAAVQAIFAVALVPTILDKKHKPALSTCLLNGVGMAVLVAAYLSLNLWSSGIIAAVVGVQWFLLAMQRHLLNKNTSSGPSIPIGKLLDQVFMRD